MHFFNIEHIAVRYILNSPLPDPAPFQMFDQDQNLWTCYMNLMLDANKTNM